MNTVRLFIGVFFEKQTFQTIALFLFSLVLSNIYLLLFIIGLGIGTGTLLYAIGIFILLATFFLIYQIGNFERFIHKIKREKTKKFTSTISYIQQAFLTKRYAKTWLFLLTKILLYHAIAGIVILCIYVGSYYLAIPFIYLTLQDEILRTSLFIIDTHIKAMLFGIIGYVLFLVSIYLIKLAVHTEKLLTQLLHN